MARKPNYDYEKRKKEIERKTKKEQKRLRKLENAAVRAEPPEANRSTEEPEAAQE